MKRNKTIEEHKLQKYEKINKIQEQKMNGNIERYKQKQDQIQNKSLNYNSEIESFKKQELELLEKLKV